MSRPLITVKELLSQVREHGRVTMPENALVTPAARDWLQGAAVKIERVGAVARAAKTTPLLRVVGDHANPVVQTLLPALERAYGDAPFQSCHGHLAGLMTCLADLCQWLGTAPEHKGVALLRDGAIAACVANRHPHVRAAIAQRPSSMFRLLRSLGINLLILETEALSLRQLTALIDEFMRTKTTLDPAVEAALKHETLTNTNQTCGCQR